MLVILNFIQLVLLFWFFNQFTYCLIFPYPVQHFIILEYDKYASHVFIQAADEYGEARTMGNKSFVAWH